MRVFAHLTIQEKKKHFSDFPGRDCRCRGCKKDFSIASGTLFASHKLQLRCYLAAIAIFCNGVKGKSALALLRDLCVSYKCAFVLLHKISRSDARKNEGP